MDDVVEQIESVAISDADDRKMRELYRRGRQRSGRRNGDRDLAIYDEHEAGDSTYKIAERYGISQTRVSLILNDIRGIFFQMQRETWIAEGEEMANEWRKLFEEHQPLARKLAASYKRKLPACVDVEDLEQHALMGLVDAAKKFDPEKGVRFGTYAARRIYGAMVDGIRDMDWVPRLVRARGEEVVGMGSLEQVVASGDSRVQTMLHNLESDAPPPGESLDQSDSLKHLMSALPRQHRKVVEGYYRDNLTMKEIGEKVGLSESRISQLHSDSLAILKARVTRPQVEHQMETIIPPEPSPSEATTSPALVSGVFQPFRCDQIPDRRFSVSEAADEAGISKMTIYLAVKSRRPVGPRRLTFWRDGPGEAFTPPDLEIRTSRKGKGRPSLLLECDKYPGKTMTVNEAAKLAGLGKFAIYSAVKRGSEVAGGLRFTAVGTQSPPVKQSKVSVVKSAGSLYEELSQLREGLSQRMEAELAEVRDRYDREIKALETVMSLAKRLPAVPAA